MISDSEKKFFVIYQGECTVEKQISGEAASPSLLLQAKSDQLITVAKIGSY